MMTVYSVECYGAGRIDDCSEWWIERIFSSAESAEKYVEWRWALSDSFAEKRARFEELCTKYLDGKAIEDGDWEEAVSIRDELYEEFYCYEPQYIVVAREVYD